MTLWRCTAIACLLSILGIAKMASAEIIPISQNRFVLSQAFYYPTDEVQRQFITASNFGVFDISAAHSFLNVDSGASSIGYAEQYSTITPNFLHFSGVAHAVAEPPDFTSPLQLVFSYFIVNFALYEPHHILLNFSGSSTARNDFYGNSTHVAFGLSGDTIQTISHGSDIPTTLLYDLFLGPGTYSFGGVVQIVNHETGTSTIDLSLVATPVPEPGTWALMLAGLTLVVFGYPAGRHKTKAV